MFHPSLFCLSNYIPSSVNSVLTVCLCWQEWTSDKERDDKGNGLGGKKGGKIIAPGKLSSFPYISVFFLVALQMCQDMSDFFQMQKERLFSPFSLSLSHYLCLSFMRDCLVSCLHLCVCVSVHVCYDRGPVCWSQSAICYFLSLLKQPPPPMGKRSITLSSFLDSLEPAMLLPFLIATLWNGSLTLCPVSVIHVKHAAHTVDIYV